MISLRIIQIPITNTNQPNNGFSFFPSIFLDNATPIKIPTTDNTEKESKNNQLTVILSKENIKPKMELIAMMNKEVATASFIEIPSRSIKAGTMRKPPPAPINPVIIPTNSP